MSESLELQSLKNYAHLRKCAVNEISSGDYEIAFQGVATYRGDAMSCRLFLARIPVSR